MQTKTVAGRTWHFTRPIGWLSARGRGFWHPLSVAIAPEGVLYVLNSGDRQGEPITKLNFDEEFLGEFGSDDLTWPNSLALDADGNVYCSDAYGHFIAVYSPDGDRIGKWGEAGNSRGAAQKARGPRLRQRRQPPARRQRKRQGAEIHQRRSLPVGLGRSRVLRRAV